MKTIQIDGSDIVEEVPKRPSKARKVVKRKKVSITKLKHKLDAVFSKYIRAKYPKVCYTCGRTDVTLQCGHFVARSYLATRFDENNCRPQCIGCNLFGNGKPLDFEEHLKQELGEDFVEKLKAKRHTITLLTPSWYEEEIRKYEELLEK